VHSYVEKVMAASKLQNEEKNGPFSRFVIPVCDDKERLSI